MVESVSFVEHNVGIDGVGLVVIEDFGLGQLGEVLVGIRAVDDVVCLVVIRGVVVFTGLTMNIAIPTDRIINHILLGFGVVDGLRRPHLVQLVAVENVGPCIGEVDGRTGPVDKVVTLEEHKSVVAAPSVPTAHVGNDHVEGFSVLTTQDVGVAHTLLAGDVGRIDNRLTIVQQSVVVTIVTQSETNLLFFGSIAGEIGKQVALHLGLGTTAKHHRHGCCRGHKGTFQCFSVHKVNKVIK